MTKKSYWQTTASLPHSKKLTSDVKVDVAIVGGGITGVTAAYLLKKAGHKVALLERDRCAQVDTGHTTAHLTYVTDKRLSVLVNEFGRERAQAVWDAGQAAMGQIARLIETEQIDCDFGLTPGYLHAPLEGEDKRERRRLEEDARLSQELGFDARFVESVPLMDRPGICFANQARFHPLRYLAALLDRIPGGGSFVFENTEAEEFPADPLRVIAGGRTVSCEHVVIATHLPLMGKTGLVSATLFQTKLASYTSYAIGARVPKGRLSPSLYWDTADPYRYLRIDRFPRYDYAIYGGEDHKTGQEADPEERYGRLEKALLAIVPDAEVTHRWSGQVVETNDGLPLIGATAEHQLVATGFAGNGMTFGTLGAMMAVDEISGAKNPWQELFAVSRKKLRGGTWDYIKENVDFPYYFLRDRLSGAQAKSLRSVKRGEGAMLKIDGQRVAASRNQEGRVTTLSRICTHMGCVVHWNRGDATWDCPCHGSRFRPNGEVLAGPAETPLEEIDTKKEK